MGYMALTTHLWPSTYSTTIIKGTSMYLATVQTIVSLPLRLVVTESMPDIASITLAISI